MPSQEDNSRAGIPHANGEVLRPGFYVVEIDGGRGNMPLVPLWFGEGGKAPHMFHIPAAGRTVCLMHVRKEGVRLSPASTALRLRRFAVADLRQLIWLRKSDRKARLRLGDALSITPLLAANGKEGRELKKSLSILRKFGFAVSSRNFQCTPGLFDAWPPTGESPPVHRARREAGAPTLSFAVVLHLYYRDLWPEFAWCLGRLSQPFHLIVTTNEADPDFERDVRAVFPDTEIHVMENRGRDVGPFMELLRRGHLDRFDAVCKLHGKRSAMRGPRALLGHIWRRANLIDLAGSEEQVSHILRRFREDPGVGMIGSPRFHFPNEHFDEEGLWGENREKVFGLIRRLGFDPLGQRPEYFAGTMFWIARKQLQVLRGLDLSISDFKPESGAIDGTVAHAMERLFGMLPAMMGQTLEDAPVMYEPTELLSSDH